jgi:hypothetical protein
MLDSKVLARRFARIYGQVFGNHPKALTGSKSEKDAFRTELLAEIVRLVPSLKTPAGVAAKWAALKAAKFVLPPLPQGIRGRKVSASDKSAANEAVIAEMAEVGLYPVYDADDAIVDWTDVAPPEVEVEAAEVE